MSNGFLNLVNRDGINYWVTENVSLLIPGAEGDFLRTIGGKAAWASDSILDTFVTAVTASSPLASSGGLAPNISITSSTGTGAVVLASSPTITNLAVTGTLGVTDYSTLAGLNSYGANGANSWNYLQGNCTLALNPTLSTTGFAFGWNPSGVNGESIMTYYTGAGLNKYFDIESWDGTTRTSRFLIGNTGAVTIPGATTLLQTLDVQNLTTVYPPGTSGAISNFYLPNLGASSKGYITLGTGTGNDNTAVLSYNNNPTLANKYFAVGFAGGSDALRVYQDRRIEALSSLSVAGYSTLAGLNSNGATGANSWNYLQGNCNSAPNPALSATGFAFGWNPSGVNGENIMTYYTGAGLNRYFDLESWDGTTRTSRLLIDNTGAVSIPGNLTVTGAFKSPVNYARYGMSADFPWPNNTDTVCGNWVGLATAGETLTLFANNTWINNTGRTIYVTFSWTGSRDVSLVGANDFWLQCGGLHYANATVGGIDYCNLSATISMNNGEGVVLYGKQTSGFGANFSKTNSYVTYIIHH